MEELPRGGRCEKVSPSGGGLFGLSLFVEDADASGRTAPKAMRGRSHAGAMVGRQGMAWCGTSST
jgi:hypothetical protein